MRRLVDPLILRFSEFDRTTKDLFSYIARGGFWLFSGYAVQIVFGVILAVSFANILPKNTYGTYQFIISAAAVVSVFTLTGMGSAIARAAAQGSKASLRYGTRMQLLWSSAVFLVSITLAGYYSFRGNDQLVIPFIVLGTCQPFILAFGLFRNYLYGTERFKQSVGLEVLQRVPPFVAIIGTLYITKSLLALVAAYFLSQAFSLFFSYVYVVRKYKLPLSPLTEMYTYSKHLSLMESFNELAAVLDKILVWVFLGAAPLAAYALAQLPVIHLQNILGFGRTLASPKLAGAPFEKVHAYLPKAIRSFFLLSLMVVGSYIVLAPLLFAVLFPLYPEAVLYSQIFALTALSIPRSLIGEAFRAHGYTRELYLINLSAPITRILLLLGGLYFYGIYGALVGIVLSEAVTAVFQWHRFKRISIPT